MEAASSASSKKTHIALCSPLRGAGPRSYMPSLHNFSRDRSSYGDADRFIPNQSAMDFDFANYMITQSRKDKENAAGASTSKEAYQNILDEVLLNNRTRILAFNSKPHLPPERVPSSHQTKSARRQRHIPQVNALLHSLDIDSNHQIRGSIRGPHSELEGYWNESQGAMIPRMPNPVDGWITEFSHQRENDNPEAWANSFEQMHGANGWASEFAQDLKMGHMRDANIANLAAMQQSLMLAQTLGQNRDPKFQNSKFLQFVSKMSRGELIIDENQIKPGTNSLAGDWTDERELLSSHGFARNQLTLWQYPSMTKITELMGHTSRVLFMAQSPDGCTVVSAGGDEMLMFWNVFGDPIVPKPAPKKSNDVPFASFNHIR